MRLQCVKLSHATLLQADIVSKRNLITIYKVNSYLKNQRCL
jgi:hypothetical protein